MNVAENMNFLRNKSVRVEIILTSTWIKRIKSSWYILQFCTANFIMSFTMSSLS